MGLGFGLFFLNFPPSNAQLTSFAPLALDCDTQPSRVASNETDPK